jgi:membrane protein implicated in regulation of membrane protease activity
MVGELDAHLHEAEAAGRPLTSVTGPDVGAFAEQWAAVHRAPRPSDPDWRTAIARRNRTRIGPFTGSIGFAALVVGAGAIFAQKGGNVEGFDQWEWLWTITAFVFAVGEIFTAGFFLLPFAVGAGAAAVLAWIGAGQVWQWSAFLLVSVVTLLWMRKFSPEHTPGPDIGANRYRNRAGIVTETIDDMAGTGRVKVDNEEWRATAEEVIEQGARVRVASVAGTKFVVERD